MSCVCFLFKFTKIWEGLCVGILSKKKFHLQLFIKGQKYVLQLWTHQFLHYARFHSNKYTCAFMVLTDRLNEDSWLGSGVFFKGCNAHHLAKRSYVKGQKYGALQKHMPTQKWILQMKANNEKWKANTFIILSYIM